MTNIFDTFASALGGSNTTASRFATLALDLVNSDQHGRLAGLLDKFRDNGFDDAVRSWVSNGKNLAITKEDVERVLGKTSIGNIANQTGVAPDLAATELASLLPQIVDKLTPGGKVYEGDALDGLVGALKGKLGML